MHRDCVLGHQERTAHCFQATGLSVQDLIPTEGTQWMIWVIAGTQACSGLIHPVTWPMLIGKFSAPTTVDCQTLGYYDFRFEVHWRCRSHLYLVMPCSLVGGCQCIRGNFACILKADKW
jgi:hypothetical protein